MTLNRRLLLGIAPVLVIFLAVGIYAIFLFSKLGGAIDVILRENYRSVVASQDMKEASERMDSGLLFMLSGEEQKGRQLFQQYTPVLEQNLDTEAHNITLPGEGALAAKVKRFYLFHHDPDHTDAQISRMVARARQMASLRNSGLIVEAAREGYELVLAAKAKSVA